MITRFDRIHERDGQIDRQRMRSIARQRGKIINVCEYRRYT